MPDETIEPYVDVADVAEFLAVSIPFVYKAAESGDLPSYRVGARRRFLLSEVREWVRKRSQPTTGNGSTSS
jgi:excisionase family DNA binding protein